MCHQGLWRASHLHTHTLRSINYVPRSILGPSDATKSWPWAHRHLGAPTMCHQGQWRAHHLYTHTLKSIYHAPSSILGPPDTTDSRPWAQRHLGAPVTCHQRPRRTSHLHTHPGAPTTRHQRPPGPRPAAFPSAQGRCSRVATPASKRPCSNPQSSTGCASPLRSSSPRSPRPQRSTLGDKARQPPGGLWPVQPSVRCPAEGAPC